MESNMIQHYVKLTEFLGIVLGIDYEITLHDLSDINHSLIAIANGHISGRSIGAPLTNVALQIISDKSYKDSNWRLNYKGMSVDNRTLRSSTYFIKDHTGELVGLLCINFDDSRYHDLADQVLKLCHPDAFVESQFKYDSGKLSAVSDSEVTQELFFDNISVATGDAVSSILSSMNIPDPDHLTIEDRQDIVDRLEEQGIFLLKGAVKEVADALHCSQPSIYRYLNKAKKNLSPS